MTIGILKSALAACPILFLLSACTLSGPGMGEAVAVDKTITSGTQSEAKAEPEAVSDSRMVRNAISAADLSAEAVKPVAWANADTGTSGVITAIEEHRTGDQICRSFETSRQRFDGVSQYTGEACTRGEGIWTLTKFAEGGIKKAQE